MFKYSYWGLHKIAWLTVVAHLISAAPIVEAATLISGKNAGIETPVNVNTSGQITTTLSACEDENSSACRVEQQFSYKTCTADCQVKATAGFVHTVTCATAAGAAVAAAGAITIRDAATETTPIIATIGIPAAAFVPFTVTLDAIATTGIYFAYDGTLTAGSVSCMVSFR